MSDRPTLEYRSPGLRHTLRPVWALFSLAIALLPYVGRYSWRILEAFHPLDVPPWNDLLGDAAAGCLAVGLIAAPFNVVLGYICLRRYHGRGLLQLLSAISALVSLWAFISAFQFPMTWK